MKIKFHNPNDFWRERMEPYEHDDIGEHVGGCLSVLVFFLLISFAMAVVSFCTSCSGSKHFTNEEIHSNDSTRVEYIEKVVKVPVTVYVEVPAEKKERETPDTTSFLKTSFAQSTASMIWREGIPYLFHSLENIPQQIAKTDTVPVVEKEKSSWKTRRVTYTKTVIKEKKIPWWKTALQYMGIAFIIIFVLGLCFYFLRRQRP